MTTAVLTAAVDTFATSVEPTAAHNTLGYLTVAPGVAVAYVYHPVTGIPVGATLTSAVLRLYTQGSWGITPVLTAQSVSGSWGGNSVTWSALPGVAGVITTVTHASAVDADPFDFDVTSQVNTQIAAGTAFGFKIVRTDALASKAFYSHEDAVYSPTLTLTWTAPPVAPSSVSPSGGRAVATQTPTVTLNDAADVTAVQVQIDSTAGAFTSPIFDSGTVVTTEPELDLSTTSYTSASAGVDRTIRARYKNSSGIWSPYSPIAHYCYRPYLAVVLTVPSAASGGIVESDTPTFTWTVSGGTQATYALSLSSASDPMSTKHRTSTKGTALSYTLPVGIITDSSDLILALAVTDTQDREAVAGFPVEKIVSQTFSFQDTIAVDPPSIMSAVQIGTSPFIELLWERNTDPEKWVIRRDEEIIISDVVANFTKDDADIWHWIDYTASGNAPHHYRVSAKVGGQVSSRGPVYDILTVPRGIWIGDEWRQASVQLLGTDSPAMTLGETVGVYYPLRGQDAVQVTQGQRGYEGTVTGEMFTDRVSPDGVDDFTTLRNIRRFPSRLYVIAFPDLSFRATLSGIDMVPTPDLAPRWTVSANFLQQGDLLWRTDAVGSESVLLNTFDYEEGTNGAAVTTATNVGSAATVGAPTYLSSAAIHGDMGFHIPAAPNGGAVVYDVPYIGMASIYLTPRVSNDVGALCKLLPVAAGNVAYINLRLGGDLSINDSANTTIAKSHGSYGWTLGVPIRVDVMWAWSTGTITIVVLLYTTIESIYPADTFSATFASSSAPAQLYVGNGTSNKSTDYDTVRIYSGNSTPPEPFAVSTAEWLWSLPGYPTSSGITISSQVLNAASIDLAVSTSVSGAGDPVSPTYLGVQTISGDGLVKHVITGKAAATTYYAKLATGSGFIGDLIQFKTLPAAGTSFTTTMVVGSCQNNTGGGANNPIAWADALASFIPDLHLHLGDFGYWGGHFKPDSDWTKHLDKYSKHLVALPAMRQFMARSAGVYLCDDHEFCANNGESNDSTADGKTRAVSIGAMQRIFGMYPLADTAPMDSKRGLYGSFMLGSRVRVIMLDGESLDRSLGTMTDVPGSGGAEPAKSFLGPTQDAWLRTILVQPAVVNLIVMGKTILGTSATAPDGANLDKPWNYGYWRASLINWIASNTKTGGGAIKVVFIGGDRHANGYVTAAGNPLLPHPAIMASGWEMHGLPIKAGESWTASYGYDPTKLLFRHQYVQLTLTDNNTNLITLAYKSRESHDEGVTMVDGATASFTWSY